MFKSDLTLFEKYIDNPNKDNVLVLTKESPDVAIQNGLVDAVEFGPFLVVNGKKAITSGNGGGGIASRTVIAQRKDGIVL